MPLRTRTIKNKRLPATAIPCYPSLQWVKVSNLNLLDFTLIYLYAIFALQEKEGAHGNQ